MFFNLPSARPFKKLFLIAVFTTASIAVRAANADADVTETGTSTPTPAETQTNVDVVANSVVKVFSTVRYPDYYKPWSKQAPTEMTGSGVIIKGITGRRILTNAHLVLYASQVQVQAYQAGNLVSATVEAIAPGIDLAVLKLDDDAFFNSHPPLEWATTLPRTENSVMVYGYPLGGTSLSITKGIVSRVEFASYNYPVWGLRIQIDAAINPGNSGGPAVVGNKMVGLAFSRLGGASQNIGYIIPCEEIELFLKNLTDGHYGKPLMNDDFEILGNPTLYSFLKLDRSAHGVIVIRPESLAPDYPLKKWDVITKIGDTPVDDQGMVNLDSNLHVFFKYMLQRITKNGKVPMTVLRAGREIQVEFPVATNRPLLIPFLDGAYPSYFVYGPIVFSSATSEFISGMTTGTQGGSRLGFLAFMGSPLITRMGDRPTFENEGLVVISSPFFPHRLSKGYANPFAGVVKTINGITIKNLGHLVEVLRDSKEEFIIIEFYGHNQEIEIFPRAEMSAATDEILTDNDVRSQGSPDTLAIWNTKPSP